MTLYIVPCSATKSRLLADGGRLPARDAYQGQSFKIARGRIEQAKAQWCILSAHYGFIWPSTIIEDYNVKMTPIKDGECWDECFGFINNRQYAKLMTAERYVCLGSRVYGNAAAHLLEKPVEMPVAGLPIGCMMRALKYMHIDP